jgi:hypothetical protein
MKYIMSVDGLPQLNARLDKIARVVANPTARRALEAGGKVIQKAAQALVHRLTGMLAGDIVIVTRIREASAAVGGGRTTVGEKYVLIGPGWNPDLVRHASLKGAVASMTGAVSNRRASNRDVKGPDQTTNPGVYGYFLEVGHRGAGQGLTHNLEYRRAQRAARKQGNLLNTYTNPSSRDYGTLSVPPYPWLKPAFEGSKDAAVAAMGVVIESDLSALGL